MSVTKIEWATHVWNPIVGCSVVSPGCTNCYAMKMAARLERITRAAPAGSTMAEVSNHYAGTTQPSKAGAVWTGKVAMAPDHILTAPLRWKKPRRIFVNSMGDLFHESVPDEWIDRVFAVMAMAPQHTFFILTKRAKRMRTYISDDRCISNVGYEAKEIEPELYRKSEVGGCNWWPLPNAWMGVSTERQQEADERIPHLLNTPAAVRFVSAEPLLGEVDLRHIRDSVGTFDALSSKLGIGYGIDNAYARRIDWIIAGGESGPGARPMHPDWARSLRDQCAAANVPYFFKQWGEFLPDSQRMGVELPHNEFGIRVGKKRAGRLLDGKEHNAMPTIIGGRS
jgi:protein gp37